MKTLRVESILTFDQTLSHFFEIASNPRYMQLYGQKSNHTCNQQVECKMIPQATQKGPKMAKFFKNSLKTHSNVYFKMKPQGTYDVLKMWHF